MQALLAQRIASDSQEPQRGKGAAETLVPEPRTGQMRQSDAGLTKNAETPSFHFGRAWYEAGASERSSRAASVF